MYLGAAISKTALSPSMIQRVDEMAGILGEIAAAKSLAEDVYGFARRAKNAGADIEDLDLKLQNDRLLLLRFIDVLDERATLLREQEIDHLRLYFRAIARELLKCTKQIETNESKGRVGRVLWCFVGREILEKEGKVGEWISGLTNWLTVLNAVGKRIDRVDKMICPEVVTTRPLMIKNLLEEGSSATVWSCSTSYHDFRPRAARYALKQFHYDAWESYERERNAMRALGRFLHPHIMPLVGSFEDQGRGHLIYPLAQGDLRSLLTHVQPEPGPRTECWLLTQMSGLAAGICLLHGVPGESKRARGSHRDLKPENILIFNEEDTTTLKLTDFGFSTFARSGSRSMRDTYSTMTSNAAKTSSSIKYGTDLYSPPKTAPGQPRGDPFAPDMWALGCVFLEMLAWYFRPPGYTPLSFHRSRVQTIKDAGDRGNSSDKASARFWTLTATGWATLHRNTKHLLETIKQLATCSMWLLDVAFHVERLLAISDKARMTAAELNTVLRHSRRILRWSTDIMSAGSEWWHFCQAPSRWQGSALARFVSCVTDPRV